MLDPVRSVPDVCDVAFVRGCSAPRDAQPDLLLEVAHGATRERDYDALRQALHGSYPDDLKQFFFVNTDVGAPELAEAVARDVVRRCPTRSVVIVRCLVPRTFLDCNRRIERDAVAKASAKGEMTPGLQPWVQDPRDRELLLDRYFAYRAVVTAAFAAVEAAAGQSLFVHTYAPRSIDVAFDGDIVRNLRAAYAPERLVAYALRPEVDLITHDPDGRLLASPALAEGTANAYAAAGFQVARNATYALHPVTLAHHFAAQRPDATLCLELRRDLLVAEFMPFVPLHVEAAKLQRAALPLAAAVAGSFV
jgi:predicted N-formylglutamate amidohydrolase